MQLVYAMSCLVYVKVQRALYIRPWPIGNRPKQSIYQYKHYFVTYVLSIVLFLLSPSGPRVWCTAAAAAGTGEVAGKDGNNVAMSVVTSLPSCLTGGSPTEIGRSEMMGQKEGVVSLDLCL